MLMKWSIDVSVLFMRPLTLISYWLPSHLYSAVRPSENQKGDIDTSSGVVGSGFHLCMISASVLQPVNSIVQSNKSIGMQRSFLCFDFIWWTPSNKIHNSSGEVNFL